MNAITHGRTTIRSIMSEFYHSIPPGSPKPKVLGMTASPIYQKTLTRDVAVSQLVELQKCLDCRIVTVKERGMLDGFVSKAKEYLIEYNPVAEGMVYDKAISKNDAGDLDWMEELTLSSSGKLFAYYVYVLNRIQALDASLKESVGRCLTLVKELEIDLGVWCAGRVAMRLFNSICYNRKRAQTDDVKADSAIQKFHHLHSQTSFNSIFGNSFIQRHHTETNILCELLMQLSSVHFPGLSCGFVTGQGSSSNAPIR
ncbi:hypothetical protein BCR33DRAFT_191966 [Rhizoclosmatium globosum]|uniref:Uncharacterized protein n=1 Tax=Rhizoclosmatium globosum TaxID=329046 RepID=A0A1Y2D246_9FUNG|nr:hypothetical protein BCR33DRAFT_191966 [Rhizoclosmatium globosum]|eukprot:ORY53277.1 hypothetical protein BCR33DRAFT_191966 [Rhizoclosmatium globosum]